MSLLAILIAAYAATWLVPRLRGRASDQWRYALAAGMTVAGLAHLFDPTQFVQMIPSWVPAREPLVFVSGLAEIALGAGLLTPQPRRRLVGLALAAYLVAVFPANVYVAVAGVDVDGQPGGLYSWLRLPLQALFVWLALWTTTLRARQRGSRDVSRRFASGAAQVDTAATGGRSASFADARRWTLLLPSGRAGGTITQRIPRGQQRWVSRWPSTRSCSTSTACSWCRGSRWTGRPARLPSCARPGVTCGS